LTLVASVDGQRQHDPTTFHLTYLLRAFVTEAPL